MYEIQKNNNKKMKTKNNQYINQTNRQSGNNVC